MGQPTVEIAVRIKPAHRRGVPHSIHAVQVRGPRSGGGEAEPAAPSRGVHSGVVASRDFQCEHQPLFSFSFDKVFDTPANTLAVYRHSVRPLVHSAIAGGDAVCFVYGERCSGRNFTLHGARPRGGAICPPDPAANLGLVAFAALELLRYRQPSGRRLELSYVAVHNENITDLLSEGGRAGAGARVDVAAGPHGETVLRHLRRVRVGSLREVDSALGDIPHQEWVRSAHSVLTFHTCPEPADEDAAQGRLHFVLFAPADALAAAARPTPRAGDAAAAAPQPRQAAALQAVRRVLTDIAHDRRYIPFRASKLTRFLGDSLSARTPCLFLVCSSTTPGNYSTALLALKFIDRLRSNAHPLTSGVSVGTVLEVDGGSPQRAGSPAAGGSGHFMRSCGARPASPLGAEFCLSEEDAALLNVLDGPESLEVADGPAGREGRSMALARLRQRLIALAEGCTTACDALRRLGAEPRRGGWVPAKHLRRIAKSGGPAGPLCAEALGLMPPDEAGRCHFGDLLALDAAAPALRPAGAGCPTEASCCASERSAPQQQEVVLSPPRAAQRTAAWPRPASPPPAQSPLQRRTSAAAQRGGDDTPRPARGGPPLSSSLGPRSRPPGAQPAAAASPRGSSPGAASRADGAAPSILARPVPAAAPRAAAAEAAPPAAGAAGAGAAAPAGRLTPKAPPDRGEVWCPADGAAPAALDATAHPAAAALRPPAAPAARASPPRSGPHPHAAAGRPPCRSAHAEYREQGAPFGRARLYDSSGASSAQSSDSSAGDPPSWRHRGQVLRPAAGEDSWLAVHQSVNLLAQTVQRVSVGRERAPEVRECSPASPPPPCGARGCGYAQSAAWSEPLSPPPERSATQQPQPAQPDSPGGCADPFAAGAHDFWQMMHQVQGAAHAPRAGTPPPERPGGMHHAGGAVSPPPQRSPRPASPPAAEKGSRGAAQQQRQQQAPPPPGWKDLLQLIAELESENNHLRSAKRSGEQREAEYHARLTYIAETAAEERAELDGSPCWDAVMGQATQRQSTLLVHQPAAPRFGSPCSAPPCCSPRTGPGRPGAAGAAEAPPVRPSWGSPPLRSPLRDA
eukprot:TRINITY_DN682_c1_g1_i2.p1 TRINITY_DN682_c1_g1~~TRINITY_DN682_c1_g1_i2.p1  ORF type:complete len:1082 (+),score=273.26 TRINITY_DN682_c1_g1_i2:83-3328(+)